MQLEDYFNFLRPDDIRQNSANLKQKEMEGEKLMPIQYLFDENVDPAYVNQNRRRNPDMVVVAVGELTAPSQGTLDPEILIWCEIHNFILVTNNRRSMPVHLTDHLEQNRHIPGILS